MRVHLMPSMLQFPSMRATIFLFCLVMGFLVPRMACAQRTEGNRLLNAGNVAYQKGEMTEAARLYEQARAIYTREFGEDQIGRAHV